MKTLQDAFEQLAPRLQLAERQQRRTALDALLTQGWPTRKQEAWRYTDLGPLAEARFAPATRGPAIVALTDASTLAFTPGSGAPLPDDHLAQGLTGSLVQIFGEGGMALDLHGTPACVDAHTSLGAGVGGWAHRVHLRAGARATLLLRQCGGEQVLDAQSLHIALEAGSQLQLVRVADTASQGTQLTQTRITQAADSQLTLVDLMIGSGRMRHELHVQLDAPGAQATLHALAMPVASGQADLQLRLVHGAPHGTSRAHLRAVAADQTRATLSGRIVVSEGARKTDSEQHMASLLLSPKAEVNAKPDLEIYNDDVKCAHGASFGQLDEDALFYLRARGLNDATARALLTQGFAEQVLREIPDEALRTSLTDTLLQRLRDAEP